MNRPKVGEKVTAYFGDKLQTATVVEWQGRKCFFDNCWFLRWGGESVGFLLSRY